VIQNIRVYPIIILILLGIIAAPVLGVEVMPFPNGDVSSGDIGWSAYYHADTGVTEMTIYHSGVKRVYRNHTLIWTNDKDDDKQGR
jgi:hypothetical protein